MDSKGVVLIFIVGMIFTGFVLVVMPQTSADDNNVMTVEVNLVGFDAGAGDYVSIEVPEYIYLGSVNSSKSMFNETKVYMNNTGNLSITITPMVLTDSKGIMNYLSFRETRTHTVNGSSQDTPFIKIGDFNFNVAKPTPLGSKKSKYFYMSLNLTDFDGSVSGENVNYSGQIKFLAMSQ